MGDNNGPDTTFTITGGPGRIQYTVSAIEATSRGISLVGQELHEIALTLEAESRWLASVSESLVATSPAGRYASPFHATPALDAITSARRSAGNAGESVEELARHAAAAAERYVATEGSVASMETAKRMQALRDGSQAWAWGPLAPVVAGGQAWKTLHDGSRDGMRDKVEDMLNDGPAYLAGLLGPGVAVPYLLGHWNAKGREGNGVVPAIIARKLFDWAGADRPGHLVMHQVPSGEWGDEPESWGPPGRAMPDAYDGVAGEVAATFESMLAGSRGAYSYPPGSIVVLQLDRPDGTRAWIVHLPGTEDWSTPDSSNPWDLEGDLEAMTAEQRNLFVQKKILIQELIEGALADAGALPTDEVMMTGHSGGGIHAASAASDPAFLAKVNVTMVVMAGSPGANHRVAPGIDVLDIENDGDVVTAADYGPPPDTPNWVTVTTHRPGPQGGVGGAHSVDKYVDDAGELDRSADPGIGRLRDKLNLFLMPGLPGGPVKVRKLVYQGTDVDDPRPKPPPPPPGPPPPPAKEGRGAGGR
ncbi:hypothetical protein QO003_002445 [Arthrobacter silviterrae]|uniref:Alpha/beta hydrolase n=1 Tax=Arthrobacter silviterrae TaxID=2026658 RepID=A0ABX0DJI1_9MICC|nr:MULTISPECIES: hypothetical protein [Arthrobacter]MCU6481206.1 hypothetical protein [Arthrobacter sp. A2-55]MDQ0278142.1 hypothetical protein [Arthrobacter silviterrae]NGN84392.1 hypothetical protein [Arthrobacter silviterrae]